MMELMINIVAGIIIDTYVDLNDDYNEQQDEKKNTCFICGLDKNDLDKGIDTNKDFAYHIQQNHHMWNYIFYYAYLSDKETTDYNGNETYIYTKIMADENSWFPIGRAMNIAEDDKEEENVMSHFNKIN